MKRYGRGLLLLLVCPVALSVAAATNHHASVDPWTDGRWRFELGGATAIDVGSSVDRSGDRYFTGSLEYEIPLCPPVTLAVRAYPLFLYHQHDEPDRQEDNTIYGTAAGLAARCYQNPRELNGLYVEIGSALMWHTDHFYRNNSRWNFLSEAGIGYQFDNNWHVVVTVQHISNAGLRIPNSGVNGLALLVGATF